MYDCKAPLSSFYYPDTRRIINAFIIIIIIIVKQGKNSQLRKSSKMCVKTLFVTGTILSPNLLLNQNQNQNQKYLFGNFRPRIPLLRP